MIRSTEIKSNPVQTLEKLRAVRSNYKTMTPLALSLLIVLGSSFILNAQPILYPPVIDPNGPKIVFDETTFDFQTVKQGDTIHHDFRFTNKGKSPLLITDVGMSCGCQNAHYSKEPIAPGKTGVIEAWLITTGKMGPQDKTYVVHSNSTTGDIVLHVMGTVGFYRTGDHGPIITFKQARFNFDSIVNNASVEHRFTFINTGDQPLLVSSADQGEPWYPDYTKEPIAPGDSGFVTIHYAAVGKHGPFWKSVTVKSNALNGDVCASISGYVRPDPNGPKIQFDTMTFNYDTIVQGSIIYQEFRFRNVGKQPLVISSVVNGDGGMYPDYYPKEPIAPGHMGIIRMKFNSVGKLGHQEKAIFVDSNAINGQAILHWSGTVIASKPLDSDSIPVPLKR